jgi:hypothetical protein
MTTSEPPAAAQLPAIVIVDADPDGRNAMRSALARRFGADYRILAADSAASGLAVLERLSRDGNEVAVVAADRSRCRRARSTRCSTVRTRCTTAPGALLVATEPAGTRIPFGVLPGDPAPPR